jgi:hypothetical protein
LAWAAVVIVVGVALLVALAPTLLSTSPVVRLALGQVNKRLNGRVEIGSVSLGWLTGVRVDGLRVYDDANVQIASADHVACPMPLWRAATGKYPLGHTVVDGLAFDARVDSQGRLNFASLAKTTPATPAAPTPAPTASPAPAPSKTSKPSELPDVFGEFELTNSHGSVAQAGKPTVFLTQLAGVVKIPGMNDPITDHLDATLRVGDGGHEGHVTADGTASAIRANVVDLTTANVHQTADATGIDLATLKPFVVGLETATGLFDGHLSVDLTDGKSAVLDASLTGKQRVAVGGPLLKGDTYSTNTFVASIPKLSATFPDGLAHWQTGHVRGEGGPILFKVDQGQCTVTTDLPVQGLLNLADGKPPGAAGTVALTDHFDVGAILTQLKNTAHLSDGAKLTGGTLDQTVTLALTPERGTVVLTTDLANVTGTRDGKAVAIQPVSVKLSAADVGGEPLDGLRDLSLTLSSRFAHADFHGANVGDLTGTLTAQLQSFQAEAGQLFDFGGKRVAGDVAIHLADSGQLMRPPYQAQVRADVSVKDLSYADKSGPRVAEPLVLVNLTGDVQGSERSPVETVRNLLLTVKAGAADAPDADVAASVPTATLGASPSADFQLTRFVVNLPQVQRQLANVPVGTAGVVCDGGTFTGTSSGHYGPDGIRLDATHLSLANLVIQKQLKTGQKVAAINGDSVNLSVAGTVGLGDATTVKLTDLSVADVAKIIDIHKDDGDLTVSKSKDAMSGKGTLAVMVELGSVNDILRLLDQETVDAPAPGGRVRTGHLSGTLAFTTAATGRTDIKGDFDVPNLDVASATGDPGPQHASIVLRAASDDAAHTLTAEELRFTSPFATAAVTNLSVLLTAPNTVDQLQRASVAIDVPDLKTLTALSRSFSPPAPVVKDAVPPLVFTGGTVSIRADVLHDGNNLVLAVPTLSADKVAFTRGTVSYAAKPITAKLAARVGTAAGKSVMQQLRGLTVTQLEANVGVATVAMTTPITVADLGNPAASAAGGIKVDGELVDITALAAAVGGKPADAYPYRGHLTVTQNLVGDSTALAVQGTANVDKFQVMQGQTVQFAEDQLAIADDVSVPSGMTAVGIRNLSVAMRSSGALNLAITNGRIDDLPGERRLKLPVSLHYDLAKLWPIVHPMLLTPGKPDAYADLKVTGTFDRPAMIAGSYPANVPFTTAVKTLAVDGGLSVGSLEHSGLTVKTLDVPFTLRNGKLVTVDGNGNAAAPAIANDGQLDLGNLTVDLTTEPPTLTTPARKAVLTHATINPLFSQSVLAKVVNNPVFAGAQQATGLIDFTIDDCHALPLGNLVTQAVPANAGSADLRFSLTDLHIGLQGLGKLSAALRADSFEANIRDGTVAVAHGISTQHVKFVTGAYAISFDGKVRLADQAFIPMTVTAPLAVMVQKSGVRDPNVLRFVPDQVVAPVKGTVSHPDYSAVVGGIAKAAADAGLKAAASLLGGNKGGGNAGDALGGLLKNLGKKK